MTTAAPALDVVEKRAAEVFSVAGLRASMEPAHVRVSRLFKLAENVIEAGRFASSKKSGRRDEYQKRDYFAPLYGVACLLAARPDRARHGYERLASFVGRRMVCRRGAAMLAAGKPQVEAELEKLKSRSWSESCRVLRKLIRCHKLKPPMPPHSGKVYDRCRVESLDHRRLAMEGCCYDAMGLGQVIKPGHEDRFVVYHGRCKDPVCPTCTRIDAARLGGTLSRLIANELAFGQADVPADYAHEADPVKAHWADHEGARLMFSTFTLRHTKEDSLRTMLQSLARAWALFIRDELWSGSKRDHTPKLFSAYVRKLEIEYTAAGWHVHLHLLWKLNAGHAAWHWRRDVLNREIRKVWKRVTSRHLGRESYQVDLQEIRKAATPGHVLRPLFCTVNGKRQFLRMEERPIADTVAELIKYVTKENGKGAKKGQLGLYDFDGPLFLEYIDGVAQKNIVRSSKAWAQVQKAWEASRENRLQLEKQAQGERRVNWPFERVMEWARAGARNLLTRQDAGYWAEVSSGILLALSHEGARRSRRQLEPYVRRFLGDLSAELKPVLLFTWQCLPFPDGPPAPTLKQDWDELPDVGVIRWDFDRAFNDLQMAAVSVEQVS